MVGETAAMALDAVKMNRFTLAFDDAGLEREFLDEYADSMRMQMRYLLLVVAVLLPMMSFLDPPDARAPLAQVLRLALGLPVALVGLGQPRSGRTSLEEARALRELRRQGGAAAKELEEGFVGEGLHVHVPIGRSRRRLL
jgi:hypothetical protein